MIAGLVVFCVAVCCLVCYRFSLVLYPYTRCPRCKGSGRNDGSNRKRWGSCRKCGGSGKRERFGRRVLGIGRGR